MSFALVAYLLVAGQVHAYKLDSNLSYSDCQSSIQAGVQAVPGLPSDLSVKLASAPLVCEIEVR